MERRIALGLVAVILLVGGLLLGLLPVGDDCGSAFSPDYAHSQLADDLGPTGGAEAACRDSVGERRPFAFGALGAAAFAGILALAVPGPSRREAADDAAGQFRNL